VQRAIALIPPRLRARVTSFTSDCDTVLGQYLRGQLIVMLLMAAFYSVGLALFGFDLAVPVGVFTGLAIFVPYVGFGIGLVLALLAGALQFTGWYGPIAVFVVYGIGQIVEGLFLTPKMVGERIGMSPLTVIFALFAFGHLLGFVGVLIALPASALTAVAAARLRAGYTQSALYTDG
jgi:predicted PurR-regulated permease PerM